jgi:hypothetical protein
MCMCRSHKRLPATTIALYQSLTALSAMVLSLWILDSSIVIGQWFGAALIILGLVATTIAQVLADREDRQHDTATKISNDGTNGNSNGNGDSNDRHANESNDTSDHHPLLTDADHHSIERGDSPSPTKTTSNATTTSSVVATNGPRQRATTSST